MTSSPPRTSKPCSQSVEELQGGERATPGADGAHRSRQGPALAADLVVGAGGPGLPVGRGLGAGGVRPQPAAEHRRLCDHGGPSGHQPGHPDPGGHPGQPGVGRPDRPAGTGQERPAGQGRLPGHAHHRRGGERHLFRHPQTGAVAEVRAAVDRRQPGLPQAVGGGADRHQQGAVSTKDGKITIDLGQVEIKVKKELRRQRASPSSTRSRRSRGSTSCCSSPTTWFASRSW